MDPIRVLVVDDEPAMAMVTKLYLEDRNGYACDVCASAPEALHKLEASPFDIIVSDYQMPGMDGIAFLKAVRARFEYIPFILFTGRSREDVVIEALNNGADFYLQKGVDPEAQFAELAHKIRHAFERRRSNEALLESESLKRIILDNVTEDVVFQDAECRIIWANRAAHYSTGRLGEEIAGRYCYEVWQKRSQPCENCPVLMAIHTGEPHAGLTTVPGGGEWIVQGIPVRDAKGDIIGAVRTGLEVTALKAVEDERMQSKEQLDLAIEAANLAVWDWYPAERRVLYSDVYAAMLGYGPDDLALHDGTFAHMVHPDDLPATVRAIHEHFEGNTPIAKAEFRMRCRDGAWKWIYACGRAVERDNDGTPLRVVGVHQDINECKAMEQTLRESEQRLKTAIEGAGICVWEKDLRSARVINTDNIAGILGYAPEELETADKDPQAWVHPADLAGVQAALAGNLSGIAEFAEATFRLKSGDGTWKWFTTRGRTVEWDAQGTPIRRLGILQDITTNKNLESQIIAGRDLAFGLAGASSPEKAFSLCISFAMDVSGMDCGGLFLYDEESGEMILVHAVGLSDGFVKKEAEKKRSPGRIREVLEGGPRYPGLADLDDYHRQLLGEEGIRAVAVLPVLFEGRPIGCINIASHTQDEIPEESRKALEAMTAEIGSAIARIQAREGLKKSNEALKSANHVLNLLSSVTRHDILNQVSALKAYLILIEEDGLESPCTRDFCRRMKAITDTIRRQITFTGDYQNMGERDPEWQHVVSVMERAAAAAVMNGIHLDVAAGSLEVFADPMLEKVFFNLLENAVSHGQCVSRISVAVREVDGHALLIVEDDGVGIPGDMKQHIFEKGVGANTGYGLFLVREILEITGMTIQETGEEGEGARFEIHIPEGRWRTGTSYE